MNQVKTAILQQCWQMCFYKKAYKIDHGAHVGHRSRNKSIIVNQIN